jgi:hypothetical protein
MVLHRGRCSIVSSKLRPSITTDRLEKRLHSFPAEASYEDIVWALQDRFGNHQLAAVYRSQLKSRVQTSDETLQEFAAAVEQLAHWALGLPVGIIQTEAAHAMKQRLLMGGDRTLNEALHQAVKLEEAKAAARPPAHLPVRKVVEAPAPPIESHRSGSPVCWECGSTGHLRKDTPWAYQEAHHQLQLENGPCNWKDNRRHETGAGGGAHNTMCHVFA